MVDQYIYNLSQNFLHAEGTNPPKSQYLYSKFLGDVGQTTVRLGATLKSFILQWSTVYTYVKTG